MGNYFRISYVVSVFFIGVALTQPSVWAQKSQADRADAFCAQLHEAVEKDDLKVVKSLVKKLTASQIVCRDIYGITALHLAANRRGNNAMAVMEALISKLSPDQVHTPDDDGWTALHIAVVENDFEMVRLLLRTLSCRHILHQDDEGFSVIDRADSKEMKSLLAKHMKRKFCYAKKKRSP